MKKVIFILSCLLNAGLLISLFLSKKRLDIFKRQIIRTDKENYRI